MKVLQINATYGIGSTGTICEQIKKYLEAHGHECLVYHGNGSTDSTAVRMTSARRVKIEALRSRITGLQGYGCTRETKKLVRDIQQNGVDVVHLHNLHGNYVNVPYLLRFLKASGVKTVITLHDCWFFTGKCTHYVGADCDGWQKECGRCPLLKADIPSILFDRTSRMLKDKRDIFSGFDNLEVIAVSDWIKGEAQKSILGQSRITRIYNWLDSEVFYPRAVKQKSGFTVLGVSAKWTADMPKFKDFIRLAEKLPEDCAVYLVGRMDSSCALPKNVISIPYVSDMNKMAELYSEADVYVHLSRADSFGKVITEALACGTPAIVYGTTACPELVGEGGGYVAELGNIDEVAGFVEEVRKNGKESYSQRCIELSRRFDKEGILAQTLSLYEKKN